ncbi:hypothetical protein P170DRAFT_266616 [Aspergillus steynii IBT 23096]|uniref:Uncharacterized protein n=1 Tax=Aspergillus steynii IBT 23096 TaxID=1392250 RepID=A0A2I2FVT9_9EURO|nr:uncharacterized protein P170DRAFT_266616 [Aspergillus steynii IBT 23096]PLB44763.1 hypothetical protein P170DRAFT_266616 [Aspergillus steynii IBT 23096]
MLSILLRVPRFPPRLSLSLQFPTPCIPGAQWECSMAVTQPGICQDPQESRLQPRGTLDDHVSTAFAPLFFCSRSLFLSLFSSPLQRLGTDLARGRAFLQLATFLALSNSSQLNLGRDGLGALGIAISSSVIIDHTVAHVNLQQEQQTYDLFVDRVLYRPPCGVEK